MAAKYDFKTSPDIQGEKEQPTLYPQIVVSGTKKPERPGKRHRPAFHRPRRDRRRSVM